MRIDRALACAALLLFAAAAAGQLIDIDPDWKETEVPPPPAFRTDRLIRLEMPRYLATQFGVDPQTLQVTPDGLVRYVIVARAPGGTSHAMYEGLRCQTGEVKTYARYGSNASWSLVRDPQWRALSSNQASAHSLALARQGACDGRAAAAANAATIIRNLTASEAQGPMR
jgi:hypothetical protein